MAKRLALPVLLGVLALAVWVLLRDGVPPEPPPDAADLAHANGQESSGANPLGDFTSRTEIERGHESETGGPSFTGARELGIPSFVGTVLGEDGKALANVAITAAGLIGWSGSSRGPDRTERMAAEFTARTGADGRFALPEAPRDGLRFEIVLSHPSHAPLRLLNQPAWPGRTRNLGELRLARGFSVSGHALAPDGSPLGGAEILAYPDPALNASGKEELDLEPLRGMGALTDREGAFTLDRLPPGRIRVRATAAGFSSPWSPPLTGQEGEKIADLILQLRSAQAVTGIVLDGARQAVPGAAVRAQVSTASPWPNHEHDARATTDVGGKFTLQIEEDLRSLTLFVSAPGHSLVKRSFRPDEITGQTIEIQLQALPSVRGLVLDEAGLAVAGAQVILTPPAQTAFHPRDRRAVAAAISDGDGAFALDFDIGLLAGSNRVEVLAWDDRHAPAPPVRLDLRSGALDPASFPLRLVLPAGISLSGQVLSAQSAALAGARVHLRKLQAPRVSRLPTLDATARGGIVIARTTSSADGGFSFSGLAPGDYRVEAFHASCSPGESEDLAVLESATGVELRLPAPCGITGTVEGDLRALPWLQVLAAAPGRETLEAAVDQAGAFRFEAIAPDNYSLTLQPSPWGGSLEVFSFAAGQPLAQLEDVAVAPGAMVPVVLRMELEGFGRLEGRVLADGVAAIDFGIYLFPSGLSPDPDPSLNARQQLASLRRSTTDRDGRFSFSGLEAREWLVVVCKPGGEPEGLRAKDFPEQVRGLARRRIPISTAESRRADFELRFGTLMIEVSNSAERVAEREVLLRPLDDAGTVRSVVVGRKGARLAQLASGTYSVTLPEGASTPTSNVFIPPEGVATLQIELPVRPPRRD